MADDNASRDLTESLRQELETLETDVQKLSGDISKQLAKALVDGQALDDVLRKLIVDKSNTALSSSVDAVYGLAGSLGQNLVGSVLGGLTSGTVVNMNVTAQDAASFSASETQIASSLSRAVARGNRSL